MPKRMNFTRASIDAIKPPTEGRLWIYDTKQPGLALRVTPANSRSYYVYRRVLDKEKGISVPQKHRMKADPSAITVDQARHWAREKLVAIGRGENPNAEISDLRNRTTFGQVWTSYLEKYLKPKCRPKSVAEFERIYKNHLTALANRSLDRITSDNVTDIHIKVGERGHYMANRTLEVVKAVFYYAIEKLNWVGVNPAIRVDAFDDEEPRRRYLSDEECNRLKTAIEDDEDEDLRDYVNLLFATAARRGNVEKMRWDGLDLARGYWSLRKTETKSRKTAVIGLTDEAVKILKARERIDEYVFPQCDFRKGWERVRKAAKLDGENKVTRHDIRRTVLTRAGQSGMNQSLLMKLATHESSRCVAVYVVHEAEEAKAALQAVAGISKKPAPKKAPTKKARKAG